MPQGVEESMNDKSREDRHQKSPKARRVDINTPSSPSSFTSVGVSLCFPSSFLPDNLLKTLEDYLQRVSSQCSVQRINQSSLWKMCPSLYVGQWECPP
ncbi:hypothetical protein HUJ04_005406 [Dendroctonus ponderosae]|nr:hypothetical protein HUJ04_005406 [Dendroctonus ponderosae]